MRSTIVLFILAFAVLGLLLGFAETYNTGSQKQNDNITMHDNVTTSNSTQSGQPSNSSGTG